MAVVELQPFIISEMQAGDLVEVLAIEREVFPVPWTEVMFRQDLLFPLARLLTARTEEGRIAGYIDYWFVADEVHLHNLAVKKGEQRKGAASALLKCMTEGALQRGIRYATLEVRPSNRPALALYERSGFKVTGVRPAYYGDTKEDALIMWMDLEGKGNSNE